MAITRISFLKIPLDIVRPQDLEESIKDLLSRQGPQHIMLVTLWDVLRAKYQSEYRAMVNSAALVIPVSKSLVRGAVFLKKTEPSRYQPFVLIISILGILEKYYKNTFFFGARPQSLLKAEKNVRSTFPKLAILGRSAGYYHKSFEKNILLAINKASPSFVLLGDGIHSGQKWIHRNRSHLHNGIFLWDPEVFDIFSERKNRISEKIFEKGLEFIPYLLKNPLRIFRIFQYLWYTVLLLTYRVFKLN